MVNKATCMGRNYRASTRHQKSWEIAGETISEIGLTHASSYFDRRPVRGSGHVDDESKTHQVVTHSFGYSFGIWPRAMRQALGMRARSAVQQGDGGEAEAGLTPPVHAAAERLPPR